MTSSEKIFVSNQQTTTTTTDHGVLDWKRWADVVCGVYLDLHIHSLFQHAKLSDETPQLDDSDQFTARTRDVAAAAPGRSTTER